MTYRFKTDENLPEETAALIRSFGFDCETVREEGLAGAVDPDIAARCRAERRSLVTLDLDFADIRAYPPETTPGIIVLRPARQTPTVINSILTSALGLLGSEKLDQRLWVCDEAGCRVRGG